MGHIMAMCLHDACSHSEVLCSGAASPVIPGARMEATKSVWQSQNVLYGMWVSVDLNMQS